MEDKENLCTCLNAPCEFRRKGKDEFVLEDVCSYGGDGTGEIGILRHIKRVAHFLRYKEAKEIFDYINGEFMEIEGNENLNQKENEKCIGQ